MRRIALALSLLILAPSPSRGALVDWSGWSLVDQSGTGGLGPYGALTASVSAPAGPGGAASSATMVGTFTLPEESDWRPEYWWRGVIDVLPQSRGSAGATLRLEDGAGLVVWSRDLGPGIATFGAGRVYEESAITPASAGDVPWAPPPTRLAAGAYSLTARVFASASGGPDGVLRFPVEASSSLVAGPGTAAPAALATPEPGGLVLAATGLGAVGLGLWRRRYRRAA